MVTLFNLLRNCQTFFCILLNTCYFFFFCFYSLFWLSFYVPINQLHIFFREISVQVLCLSFNLAACIFVIELEEFSALCIQVLYQIHDLQIFSTILFSIFLVKQRTKQTNKQRTKVLNLNKAQFVSILSFVICDFGVISKNVLHNPKSQRSSPMFLSKSL